MLHCIFSDVHVHPYTQFASGRVRVQRALDIVNEIRWFCIEHQIKSAICLGDIFHSRVAARYEYFNQTFDCFQGFKNCDIDLTILAGNHDFVDKTREVTTIDTFSSFAKIVKEPTQRFGQLLLYPHTTKFSWELDTTPAHLCLLTHIDIIGAKVAKGWTCDKGFDAKSFEKFKLVLSGHFHLRQQVKENVFYVGTCCPQDFKEEGEPGYFCTLDDETAEVKWYVTKAPKFLTLDPRTTYNFASFKGSYVKVLADPCPKHDEFLKGVGALAWVYAPERKKQEVLRRQKGISPESSDEQIVKAYATVHAGEQPADKLVEVGMELLKE